MITSDSSRDLDEEAWLELAGRPEFQAWEAEVHRIGGCEHPVFLTGRTVVRDQATGRELRVFDATDKPGGVLMLPCGNRRASRCGPCSRVYQHDAFHMVRVGLDGGKGVPASVASHPRAFVTFTAPSFGLVHRRLIGENGQVLPCNPHRNAKVCGHGVLGSCMVRHVEGDPVLGTPLCPGCYDYPGAVLWNAHAGKLWNATISDVRRVMMPLLAGFMTRAQFKEVAMVSFLKVAEFQARGLVHFHAVMRLDGPEGPGEAPHDLFTLAMLEAAVRGSAKRVRLLIQDGSQAMREVAWGRQLDFVDIPESNKVAGYIAKYATKGAECVGTVDHPLTCPECDGTGLLGSCFKCQGTGLRTPLDELPVTEHARALISTAWELGGRAPYQGLHLRRWAHQFGFGGHFATKSRCYSVTMRELRQARIDYRVRQQQAHGVEPLPPDAVSEPDWEFAGSGWTGYQVEAARAVREDIAERREVARDALNDLRAEQARDDWAGPE